jgi:hypothetical protein
MKARAEIQVRVDVEWRECGLRRAKLQTDPERHDLIMLQKQNWDGCQLNFKPKPLF